MTAFRAVDQKAIEIEYAGHPTDDGDDVKRED
jgi:hypothetical protein